MGAAHQLGRQQGAVRIIEPRPTSSRSSWTTELEALHLAVDQFLHSDVVGAGGEYAGRIADIVVQLKEFLGLADEASGRTPLPVPLTCDTCPYVALSQQLGDSGPARTGPGAPLGSPATVPPAGRT